MVDKVRDMGRIRMIIGDILCLFAHIYGTPFLLTLELCSQQQIYHAVKSFGVDLHRITTDLDSG